MRYFAVTLMASFYPFLANADSPVVRDQERQGSFTITIFTPAEVSRGLPSDITVMVQSSASGQIVMDADVELGFVAPVGTSSSANDVVCGSANKVLAGLQGRATAFVATHAQAANKLLYGSSVVFPGAGNWHLRATVRHGSEVAHTSCVLPVNTSPSRLAAVWPCLALPPLAIALFACNQWLSSRQRRNLSHEVAS
jgi:hypothetical protein